jgi:hypothetical protein
MRSDPSAVFLNRRLISGVIYHADGSKEKRYLQAKGATFGRGNRKNFAFRIELNDASIQCRENWIVGDA